MKLRRHTEEGLPNEGVFQAPSRGADGLQRPIGAPSATGRTIGNFNQNEGYHVANQSLLVGQQMQGQRFGDETTELQPKKEKRRRRLSWRAFKKWSLRFAGLCAVVLIVLSGFLLVKAYDKLHNVFRGSGNGAVGLQSNINLADLKTEGDSRVNILLLGIGGTGHDGPDLTDTMLIVSIDPVNHKVALVSVPRDLWVSIPHHGNMKINAAYETGKYAYLGKESSSNSNVKAVEAGFASADSIVSQVTGVKIQYNALVDFQAFEQAVNTVGGVTVDVPTELYDPTMAWENGGNPVLAKPGVQTFDGLHALFYVRSRETTSDFARTQRQRAVIVALAEKMSTLGTLSNPVKISNLLSAFGDNVVTDISLSDAEKIYSIVKGVGSSAVESIGLADAPNDYVKTGRVGSQSVVLPTAGQNNYGAIQTFLRSQLVDGFILKENAKVLVLNGGETATAFAANVATLKSYGYNVTGTGNASGVSATTVVDRTGGKDPYTAHYLANRFNVTVTKNSPSGVSAGSADFVVILK